MRRVLLSATLAIGTIMLLAATPSFGVIPEEMHVNVPFQFVVEGTTLPAGSYVLTNPSNGNTNEVEIRNGSGKSAAIVETEPLYPGKNSPGKPDLVFERIKGTEYLAEIWADPGSTGNEIRLPENQSRMTQAAMHRHHVRGTQVPSSSSE
jgi:hypothetical protein